MYKLAWRDEGIVIIICCKEYIYIYCIRFEDVVLKKREEKERKKIKKKGEEVKITFRGLRVCDG